MRLLPRCPKAAFTLVVALSLANILWHNQHQRVTQAFVNWLTKNGYSGFIGWHWNAILPLFFGIASTFIVFQTYSLYSSRQTNPSNLADLPSKRDIQDLAGQIRILNVNLDREQTEREFKEREMEVDRQISSEKT